MACGDASQQTPYPSPCRASKPTLPERILASEASYPISSVSPFPPATTVLGRRRGSVHCVAAPFNLATTSLGCKVVFAVGEVFGVGHMGSALRTLCKLAATGRCGHRPLRVQSKLVGAQQRMWVRKALSGGCGGNDARGRAKVGADQTKSSISCKAARTVCSRISAREPLRCSSRQNENPSPSMAI